MVLKIDFTEWYILQKKAFEAARLVFGMFLDVYDLHRGFRC